MLFCFLLGEKGLGHSTIKSYLAAVRSLQIDYGFQNPFGASMPKLERIMNGIKDSQGKEGRATRRKLPTKICLLRAHWNATGFKYDECMLWAAAMVFFQIHESRGADDAGPELSTLTHFA